MKDFAHRKPFPETIASSAALSMFVVFGRMIGVGGEYIYGGWRGAWLTSLVAFALGLLIFPFFAAVSGLIFSRGEGWSVPEKIIYLVSSLAVGLGAVYVGLSVLDKGGAFVIDIMGVEINKRITGAVLLLAAAYVAASGANAVKKLSRVALAVSVISALMLFLLSLTRGADLPESFGAMISNGAFADVSVADGVKNAFLSVFAPCAVGIAWMSVTGEEREDVGTAISNTLCGLAVGAVTVVLCFLTVIFSQGLAYASTQKYPYVSAVGAMTAGKLFMRPEGAVYFAYLAAVFTVLSVCISLLSRFLDNGKMKRTPYAVSAVMMVIYIFLG